jgi:hypothetical protein
MAHGPCDPEIGRRTRPGGAGASEWTPEQRLDLALRLGDEDVAGYCAAHGVSQDRWDIEQLLSG